MSNLNRSSAELERELEAERSEWRAWRARYDNDIADFKEEITYLWRRIETLRCWAEPALRELVVGNPLYDTEAKVTRLLTYMPPRNPERIHCYSDGYEWMAKSYRTWFVAQDPRPRKPDEQASLPETEDDGQ